MGTGQSKSAKSHPPLSDVKHLPPTVTDSANNTIAACPSGWEWLLSKTQIKVIFQPKDSDPQEWYMTTPDAFSHWLLRQINGKVYDHKSYTFEVKTDQTSNLTTVTISADDDSGRLGASIKANATPFELMVSVLEERQAAEQKQADVQTPDNSVDVSGQGDAVLQFRRDLQKMPSYDKNAKKVGPLLDLLEVSVKQLELEDRAKAKDMWNTCVDEFNRGSSHDSETLSNIILRNNPFDLFKGKLGKGTLPSKEVSPFFRTIPDKGIGCKTNIHVSIDEAGKPVDPPTRNTPQKRPRTVKDAIPKGKKGRHEIYKIAADMEEESSEDDDEQLPQKKKLYPKAGM